MRVLLLTAAAMLAFAGNSLLCRAALKAGDVDAASFTAIRLAAGALMLIVVLGLRGGGAASLRKIRAQASPRGAALLFVYAAAFSYAYVALDAASGALLLFGFVQATMIAAALWRGERPSAGEAAAWLAAAAGLAWLLLPGTTQPPLAAAALMALAGIAWGGYSLHGAGSGAPLQATAANFLLSLPFLPVLLTVLPETVITPRGALLAVASGALTSGLGYVLWYAALPRLRALQAALVQLSVPILAALGGALLLAEPPTPRLLTATTLVLGGITLSLLQSRDTH